MKRSEDVFLHERGVFQHAGTGEVTEHILQVRPVNRVLRSLRQLFRSIEMSETAGEQMARLCWRLRSAILATPLPFASVELRVAAMLSEIGEISARMPSTANDFSELHGACALLFLLQLNPKHDYVHQSILRAGDGHRIGLLTATAAGRSAEWEVFSPADYRLKWERDLSIVRSGKELREERFHTLIVPTGLRWCSASLVYDILWRGLASHVEWIRYDGEADGTSDRLRPPEGEPFQFAPLRKRKRVDVGSDEEAQHPTSDQLDAWAATEYWNHIRPGSDPEDNLAEETRLARFVIFGNGEGAYLPADGRALEVSDLIGFGTGEGERRVPVQDLDAGDIIVLRTAGTDEDDVERLADQLMQKDRKPTLRQTALDWKSLLAEVLRKKGPQFVAASVLQHGGRVGAPAYLSNWAGHEVMAPQRFETFQALLLSILPFAAEPVSDFRAHILRRWGAVEELKSYHHRAGQQIRQALLAKIRTHSKSGGMAFDRDLRITIPGILGAEIALLRVAGIDPSTNHVPHSQLHRLRRVPEF